MSCATIRDTSAIAFAGSIYENLGYGLDVQAAIELAANSISLDAASGGPTRDFVAATDLRSAPVTDALIPRLLVRDGVDASQLRFANPADRG